MVRSARKAKQLDEELLKIGYSETPYGYICGELADAIYDLIGEKTENWEDSVTYTALTVPFYCDERRAAMLFHVYQVNQEKHTNGTSDRSCAQ